MKNKIFPFLLLWLSILPAFGQFTFKLKSVVGQSNPSANGLFSYGTFDSGGNFVLFPSYANDNSGGGGINGQLGWTFMPGVQEYPFLAYEQLTATEITPQPFPEFGVFVHPGESPTVVKLLIPQNAHILYIKSNIQRATFGCGESVGYTIQVNNQAILPRTIINTSSSPTAYNIGASTLQSGDALYFIVDKGNDGNHYCDDTALDVEISWEYDKIVTPKLVGNFDCNSTSITYDIDFQRSGTLSLYQVGNPNPIATTAIQQVGVSYKGQGTFTGLNLSEGGSFYAIASNTGQITSDASEIITIQKCCIDAVAPPITINSANICQGQTATLIVSGCTNGVILWNNGSTNATISVNLSGTYSATCTVKGTGSCKDGVSSASGMVTVNDLPTLSINSANCSADLLTYSIAFSSNGIVISDVGTVNNGIVSNIPIGTNANLKAISLAGCAVIQSVQSPVCACPAVNAPVSLGDKSICEGEVIPTLSVNVATGETADWYDAASGGNLLASNATTFTPTQAGTNYVLARNLTNNCTSSIRTAITLKINAKGSVPVISASKSPIVLGENCTLTVTNCSGTVAWNNGSNQTSITVSPNATAVYSATCTAGSCVSGVGQFTLPVLPPQVRIEGSAVCQGNTTVLNQSGCSGNFYWIYSTKSDFSNGKVIASVSMPLYEPTYFRLVCETSAGEATAETLIQPIAPPNPPQMVTDKTLYYWGEIAEVNALNCNGHIRWSNGQEGINQIRVKANQTTRYTATCISSTGCVSENSIEVIVKTAPPQVQDKHICFADVITLQSNCAAGTRTYWTENWLDLDKRIERNDGDQVLLYDTKYFAVSCESQAGISEILLMKVNVHLPVPKPIITAKDSIIINGDSLILKVENCSNVFWENDNFKGNTFRIQPTQTTTYIAQCKEDECWSEKSSFKVYVRPKQPILKTTADTLCVGNSTQISTQNCEEGGKLHWLNDGSDKLEFIAKPTKDTLYQVVCISLDSLVSDTTKVKIKVYPIPNAPTLTISNAIILEGERAILKATNYEGIIRWNNGATTSSISIQPTRNTTYSATCTIWQCTSKSAEIAIGVRPKQPEISNGKSKGYSLSDTLCLQKQLTLSIVNTCNGTIHWSNGQTGQSIIIIGLEDTIYKVYCESEDLEKSDESTIQIKVLDYNIADTYIYPNPTSGKLYIQSKGCIDGVLLRLFTQRGELLYEGGGQERYLDSLVLDLFNLPSTEYILHIIGTDGSRPVVLKKRVLKTN